MTALCAFLDLHSVSMLLYKNDSEFWFGNFPYVYVEELFSASFDRKTFYTEVFASFCKDHKVDFSKTDLLLTGITGPVQLNFETKANIGVSELISKVSGPYPILVNNSFIITKDFLLSQNFNAIHSQVESFENSDESNYYANLALYPQVVPADFTIQLDLDRNIAALLRPTNPKNTKTSKGDEMHVKSGQPIVFCGSRFSQKSFSPELDYLLMLELIKKPGVFEVQKDSNNFVILSELLKTVNPDAQLNYEVEKEATVVTTPGAVECLVETDLDTSQLVQMEKERMLVLPAVGTNKIKLKLKAREIPASEYTVSGGNLGIIFDTRSSKDIRPENIKVFSTGIQMIKGALNNA